MRWITGTFVKIRHAFRVFPGPRDVDGFVLCFRGQRGRWSRLNAWWKSLRTDVRHFLGNVMVGLFIAILLHGAHHLHVFQFLRDWENHALDWTIDLFSETELRKATIPFVWLDIDEDSFIAWGEPFHTPRAKLAQMIRFAVDAKPKAVVVDVDLSAPGQSPQADEALRDVLKAHGAQCKGGPGATEGSKCAPVILVRSYQRWLDGREATARPSFLDDISEGTNAIVWGSALYQLDRDGVVRHWRLVEQGMGGNPPYVPSVQLLVLSELVCGQASVADQYIDYLRRNLEPFPCPGVINTAAKRAGAQGLASQNAGVPSLPKLNLSPDQIPQRIIYSLAWHLRTNVSGRGATDESRSAGQKSQVRTTRATPIPRVQLGGKTVDLLQVVPARIVTDQEGAIDHDLLTGRIVVIGGSYLASNDIYQTPIGHMPGALVIINSIFSLAHYKQLQPPHLAIVLLCELFLIILMSWFFVLRSSFWGLVTSGVAVILLILPLSFSLFKYGIWLDFAFPLIAILVHDLANRFEESRELHRGC